MRQGKKGKVAPQSAGIDFGLIVKTIAGTLGLCLAAAWFGRQLIWQDEARLQCLGMLSKSKALLRVQSDLMDEALRDVGGMRDSLVLKSAELRAISVRELFTTERDRAAFDDFVLSLGRDVTEINSNSDLKSIGHRPKLRETTQRVKRNIAAVFGPEFFKGKVEFVPISAAELALQQEQEEESKSASVNMEPKPSAQTGKDDDDDDDDDEDKGSEVASKKSAKPVAATKKASMSSKKTSKKGAKSSKGSQAGKVSMSSSDDDDDDDT